MMRWMPLSVSTAPLISPTFRPKATSSKGFCISPRPNEPRSPPLAALLHSEYCLASWANFWGSSLSCCWMLAMLLRASSKVRVMGLFL